MGVHERELMGAEESRERGFGSVEGELVVGTDTMAAPLLDGCGFGLGRMPFEGTGTAVVQDIVVD
jgi:hypothetical protein